MSKTTKKLIITLIVVLLALIGVCIYYFYGMEGSIGGEKPIEMKDFINHPLEDVKAWQQQNKIDDSQLEITYEYDDVVEQDIVMSQSIEPNIPFTKKDVVKFVCSAGMDPNQSLIIPDFVDKDADDATAWFASNNLFNVNYLYEENENVEKGIVLSIDPSAGTEINQDDKITITVSIGKEESKDIVVPDFKPYIFGKMQKWGRDNNVTVNFIFEDNPKIGKGQYVRQSPNEGTVVEVGGSVNIYLSNGTGDKITNLIGKTKTEAQTFCTKNKIKPIFLESYSDQASNIIVGQDPKTGNADKITFFVSVGHVPLPNYVGKSLADFNNYIGFINNDKNKTANLKTNIVTVKSDKSEGTIIEQSPTGSCNVGATITVKVAGKGSNSTKTLTQVFQIGLPYADLVPVAKNGGYTLDVTKKVDNSKAEGTILGGHVDNKIIHVTISTKDNGNDPLANKTLDDVFQIGLPYENLAAVCKRDGYTINRTTELNNDKPVGTIIHGHLDGKTVYVTVTVKDANPDKGNNTAGTVPNVVGQSKDVAIATLKGLGLEVSTIEAPVKGKTNNTVSGQNIKPGSSYSSGQKIVLIIVNNN